MDKIAILGNMNNNGFSLLRYFLDLGIDAELLLYDNDGIGQLSHFKIENDTWNVNKWSSRIKRINLCDNPISSIPGTLGSLVVFFYNNLLRQNKYKIKFVSEKNLTNIFSKYDFIIASGIAPAVFERINRRLGIYYHYSDHIEYVGSSWFTKIIDSSWFAKRLLYKYSRKKQLLGIAKSNYVISAVESSAKFISTLNERVYIKSIPMLYVESNPPLKLNQLDNLNKILSLKSEGRFIVFSHARIRWLKSSNFTDLEWAKESKGTDILIKGFATFVKNTPQAILVLVAYGPDVESTKILIESLNLSLNVIWLPITNRKELIEILKNVNVACGEFTVIPNMIWGGTAIEALAVGAPLMQSVNFTPEQFKNLYGLELPYIFDVKNADDITNSLIYISQNIEVCREKSQKNNKYFNTHMGIGLAYEWATLIPKRL